ncbi:MAG: hypothetical protein ACREQY_01385, partial [Candidatus Binatia bacterium]
MTSWWTPEKASTWRDWTAPLDGHPDPIAPVRAWFRGSVSRDAPSGADLVVGVHGVLEVVALEAGEA